MEDWTGYPSKMACLKYVVQVHNFTPTVIKIDRSSVYWKKTEQIDRCSINGTNRRNSHTLPNRLHICPNSSLSCYVSARPCLFFESKQQQRQKRNSERTAHYFVHAKPYNVRSFLPPPDGKSTIIWITIKSKTRQTQKNICETTTTAFDDVDFNNNNNNSSNIQVQVLQEVSLIGLGILTLLTYLHYSTCHFSFHFAHIDRPSDSLSLFFKNIK